GTRLGVLQPGEAAGGDGPAEGVGSARDHAESGLVDLVVRDFGEAVTAVRRFASLAVWDDGPPGTEAPDIPPDPAVRPPVPARRTLAYDTRRLLRQLVDGGDFLELKARFARNVVTGMGRIGGRRVALVATAPMHSAGAMTPAACLKAAAFVRLCDTNDV